MTEKKKRYKISADGLGMRRIVQRLEEFGPMTVEEIAYISHLSRHYVLNQARHVLLEAKKIHLIEYRHNMGGGPFIPVYAAGPTPKGYVKPRPPRKITSAERSKRWKTQTAYNESRRANRRLQNPPDFALAALMGLASGHHKNTTKPATPAERNAA